MVIKYTIGFYSGDGVIEKEQTDKEYISEGESQTPNILGFTILTGRRFSFNAYICFYNCLSYMKSILYVYI